MLKSPILPRKSIRLRVNIGGVSLSALQEAQIRFRLEIMCEVTSGNMFESSPPPENY
jgi:hypothetical protein